MTGMVDRDVLALAAAVRDLVLAAQNYRLRAARTLLRTGPNEMMTLSRLYFDGPAGPTELAAGLSMTTASMTALLDRLERCEHVVRRPHPTDRRKILVELTPQARDAVGTAYGRAAAAVADAVGRRTVAERQAIMSFLVDVASGYTSLDVDVDDGTGP